MKWTLVQHSAYGYKGNLRFQAGLETRHVTTKRNEERIIKAGGLLFDSYQEAEDAAMLYQYPPGYEGLTPRALSTGDFARGKIDDLRIFIPYRIKDGSERMKPVVKPEFRGGGK